MDATTQSYEQTFETDPVKAIENDREFKAHIYQQLVELQPYLSAESQVAVLVQLEQGEDYETGEESTEYTLSLVATVGEYKIEAEGKDNDLYEALGHAKRKMIDQLEEVYSTAIDSSERDEQIQTLLQGGYTLH